MKSTSSTPSRTHAHDRDHPHKTTLFCPDCGHASPLDGDWDVRSGGGRRHLRCPDCLTVVDARPRTGRLSTSGASLEPSACRCEGD